MQLLLQFYADSFETNEVFKARSNDEYIVRI